MKKGFTLIEMLIVVLIIGILVAIALPQYQLARDKTKYSTIMDLSNNIAAAEHRYYLATGSYTADFTVLDIDLPYTSITGGKETVSFSWGDCYFYAPGAGGCRLYMAKNGFEAMYMYPTRACYALTTSERSKRLCQAVTGNAAGGVSGIWTYYSFKPTS